MVVREEADLGRDAELGQQVTSDSRQPAARSEAQVVVRGIESLDAEVQGMLELLASSRAAPHEGNGSAATQGVEALLAGMDLVHCSSKTSNVGLTQHHTNHDQTLVNDQPNQDANARSSHRGGLGG
ncbi:MAG TPA: hypothetical protein VGL80_17350, partial [Pseudonocardiaceae bacterium]